jgi:hypothetical protein
MKLQGLKGSFIRSFTIKGSTLPYRVEKNGFFQIFSKLLAITRISLGNLGRTLDETTALVAFSA